MTFKKKILIIAEAGINHNGSLKRAKQLIKAAKKSNADYVKFQIFKAENVVTKNAGKSAYQKKSLKDKETQYEMIKKFELSYQSFKILKKECKKNKIKFLCSPFDVDSFYYLMKLKEKIIKIPSGEITNYPLIEKIGKMNIKIIMSTGMSSYKEIGNAINLLTRNGTKKNNITLMQCTSAYPAPYDEINLNTIITLRNEFKLNVGFSDHSLGVQASIAAVALGAKVIEKHLTLNKKLKGPDHRASLNPKEFKLMVDSIRIVEKTLGNKIKKITKSEKKNIYIVRKSIVASTKIKKNEKFSNSNITCKRPGTGISPLFFNKLIGKKSIKNFNKNDLIRLK